MNDFDSYITLIDTLDRHLSKVTQRNTRYVIEETETLERFLRDRFPLSELKNLLVVYRRELHDINRQSHANVKPESEITQTLNNWVYRFQIFLPELKEYLEYESLRRELDEEARNRLIESQTLDGIYQAFTNLRFDHQQRFQFSQLLKTRKGVLFHIHGLPAHGQKWLYNRLLKIYEFLEKKPEALHRVIDLTARSSSDAFKDINLDFRHIFGLPAASNAMEELIAKITAILQERNILLAFKSPLPEVSSDLTRFFDALFNEIEGSIHRHKLIVVLLSDRIEKNVGIPPLSPIDAGLFKTWVVDCTAGNHEPIANLYQDLLDEDDDVWCNRLRSINQTQSFFGMAVSDKEPEPAVPAERFIREIAEVRLGQNWEKCKAQWMPY